VRQREKGFTLCCLELSKATVQAYRAHLLAAGLSRSTINLYVTAVRRLAIEAGDKGLLAPEIVSGIQPVRGIRREGMPFERPIRLVLDSVNSRV